MKKLSLYLLFIFFSFPSYAQIFSQGKIIFERKTNVKRQIQTESTNEWMKNMIDKLAAFEVDEFSLTFNSESSEYRFEKNIEQKGQSMSFGNMAGKNTVVTNFNKNENLSQKVIYENTYLLKDRLHQLEWKIEDEMRTIAGYHCRKALTTIDDSVVVVAFYTDEIMVSGGPERFNGLPGMILGLAIPRLYTTWFATSVEIGEHTFQKFEPAKKSKQMGQEEFVEELKKSLKDWGPYASKILWWGML